MALMGNLMHAQNELILHGMRPSRTPRAARRAPRPHHASHLLRKQFRKQRSRFGSLADRKGAFHEGHDFQRLLRGCGATMLRASLAEELRIFCWAA